MSATHVDISYDLVKGIFTVLNGNVTYGGITYPVYKSIPKDPATTYVYVGNVINDVDGDKDNFRYNGTVQVQVRDEAYRGDKKLALVIMNVIRGLLKTSVGSVFSVTPRTLVVFSPGSYNEFVEYSDNNISGIRLIEQYDFILE